MDKVIEPSTQVYDFCALRVTNLFEGLDDAAVEKRINPQMNPMIWIAGHITVSRCNLATSLGSAVDHGWGDRFARGAEVDDPRPFPKAEEVLAKWEEATGALTSRFEELSDEELSAPAPRDFPFPDKTVRGMINFLGYHEAYHVGKLGFLRQWVTRG